MALKFMLTFLVLFVFFFIGGLDATLSKDEKRKKTIALLLTLSFFGIAISAIFWIWS